MSVVNKIGKNELCDKIINIFRTIVLAKEKYSDISQKHFFLTFFN